MSVSEFNSCLIKYSKKLAVLVALAILICACVVNFRQSYTAEICIKYLGEKAEQGLTPNNKQLNPYEIANSLVVKRTLNKLGLKSSNHDRIRKDITVTPILLTSEEEKHASWIENFSDYENDDSQREYPVYYSVKFKTKRSVDFAEDFINTLISQYRVFFIENYAGNNDITALGEDEVLGYDYFETVQLIKEKTDAEKEYLKNISEGDFDFRSMQSGYSINDIIDEYSSFQKNYLAAVSRNILENGISKNPDILKTNLKNKADSEQLKSESLLAKAESQKELMQVYSEKNKQYLWESYDYAGESEQVREDTERDRVYNTEKTVYDQMTFDYVEYKSNSLGAIISKEYNEEYISYFKNEAKVNKAIEKELSGVYKEYIRIQGLAHELIEEYNRYKSGRYVERLSGVYVGKTVSVVIYYAASIVLALGLGIIWFVFKELRKKKII